MQPLGIRVRLVGQVLAGFLLVLAEGPFVAAVAEVGVVFVVGMVNTTNFMDGINGLTFLTITTSGFWYAFIAYQQGNERMLSLALTLVTASVAFGVWNLAGHVFLGDAGSYFVGGFLALMALQAWNGGATLLVALAPLIVGIVDTSLTLVQRVLRGASIGEAHRDHAYQRLSRMGLGHALTSCLVALVSVMCCLLGLLSQYLHGSAVTCAAVAVALATVYWATPRMLERQVKSHG